MLPFLHPLRAAALISAAALAALVMSAGVVQAASNPTAPVGSIGDVAPAPTASAGPNGGRLVTVPAANVTFAIGTSDGSTGDGRAKFELLAEPGQTITEHVIVYNLGKVEARLALYGIDALTAPDGSFTLTQIRDEQSGVGAWTSLGRTYITLKGGTSAVVPVTIKVPKNATPGDAVGGIVVSDLPQLPGIASTQQALSVATRVGIRTVVRVAGDLRASVAVRDLRSSFESDLGSPGFGRLTLTWTTVNTGNVRVAVDRKAVVSALLGGTLSASNLPQVETILPGDSIVETVTLDGVFAGVKLTAAVEAMPVILEGEVPSITGSTASSETWAISWILVLIIAVAVALATWLGLRFRRRNPPPTGRREAGSPPSDTAGSTPVDRSATSEVPA